MPPASSLKLGTRRSPLALAQAGEVKLRLEAAHPGIAVEIMPFVTSGDRFLNTRLMEIGNKGLFTKELEEALFDRRIDLAVHSAKDMPTRLPEGLALAAFLPREDARDVLIAEPGIAHIARLPDGARLGTSSLRRASQALYLRPDLRIVPLRGNVQTRLGKLARGEADATLLALAGLKRLRINPLPGEPLSLEEMLPAPAQGAIALECRADDAPLLAVAAALDDAAARDAVSAERALLSGLDGSCRTPIAAYAEVLGGRLRLRGMLLSEDGSARESIDETGAREEAEALGARAAEILKKGFKT